MKSERRHELQHNDLAAWFLKTYQSIFPYRFAIVGVTLLVVVIAVAWTIWRSRTEASAAEAWNAVELKEALVMPIYQNPQLTLQYANAMDKASVDYNGTSAGDWARVLTADSLLCVAEIEVVDQKDAAAQHFSQALERYEKSLASSNPMARERALFGKARVLESTGKLAEAKAAYKELNTEFPKGTYKAIADGRLEQLDNPETVDLYKAIAEYNPKAMKEKPKEVEKAAAGPRGKLEGMTLPENPEEPVSPKPPVKAGESSSGTPAITPKPSAAAVVPKPSAASVAPLTPATPKPEAAKATAAKPLTTGAPAASSSAPGKK